MPRTRTVSLRFPVGGVTRRHGYEYQPEHTTPGALNVWPAQWSTGRTRGGVRPGLASLGSVGGAPYGWCRATWWENSGTTRDGVAVVHAGGTSTSLDGSTWTPQIATAPASNFATCACYDSLLFQASGGGSCYVRDLSTNGGAAPLPTGSPTKCGLVAAAMDRIWLAGDTDNPHVLYASAIGDHTNWDYSAVEESGAFASSGVNGFIYNRITALITHGSNCLLIGERDGLAVITGNPRGGGLGRIINQMHGPIMQTAWCKDEGDNTWFLSRAGLHRIGSGCITTGANIESASRERLPDSLIGIDPGAGDWVALGYDIKHRGIHIYVDRNSGTDEYWFYDTNDGGFWPMSFPSTMNLAVPLPGIMDGAESALMAITSGGAAKQFDRDQTNDYGTAIDSYLDIGPVKLGTANESGVMVDCFATLAENSGGVAWSVRGGNSAQEAYAATPWFTGANWTRQGLNYRQHPRVMGHSAYIKLEDVSGSRWSFEELVCNTALAGPRRVY